VLFPVKVVEARGTGRWLDRSVPQRGWTCAGIEDLEEPAATCQMCQVQVIRYVHEMHHPNHHPLLVGCICAGHMEGDPRHAWVREHLFKNTQGRRARWLSRAWRISQNGWHFLNADGFNVVVFSRPDQTWGARIQHRRSGQARFSKIPYETQDAAKLAAFNAMLWMKQRLPEF
jgi:hypothetical protein